MFGMIIPGDPPATMQFTISIHKEWAQMLNSGREVLEDILILRLENGRDYYITVKATFARSCFGMSVDELVLYSDPIREVPLDPLERAKKYESMPPTALCVPKELWRLIDAIYEKGMGEPHLFVEPGNDQEVRMIRESLDTGKPFPQCQIHSYAEVFMSFLSSLSTPIIPMALIPPTDIDSNNIQMSSRRLLEDLSPIHYNVFVYIISFFREVLNLREQNKLSAAKLARICVDCMAPETGLDSSNAASIKRRGLLMIVMHLLETSSI
jgi:phosphatidylinositol-bisphosphatase